MNNHTVTPEEKRKAKFAAGAAVITPAGQGTVIETERRNRRIVRLADGSKAAYHVVQLREVA